MTILDNGSILTGVCHVLWDGITKPEDVPATKDKEATLKYNVSVAFPADAPEYGELYAAIQNVENTVKVNGQLPHAWQSAFSQVDATKIPEIPGYIKINAATFGNVPPVLDINEVELTPAQYARALYAGAKVRVIVSPRTYDAKGNKGSGFWLTALQVVDATAPQFSVASGLSVSGVKSAFGAAKVAGVPVSGAALAAAAGTTHAPVVPPAAAPAPVAPQAAAAAPTPVPPNYGAVPAPSSAGHAAPAAPGTPPAPQAAPTPPSAPAAPISPSKTLTAAAAQAAPGLSYEGWRATWSDEQMIASGYLVVS